MALPILIAEIILVVTDTNSVAVRYKLPLPSYCRYHLLWTRRWTRLTTTNLCRVTLTALHSWYWVSRTWECGHSTGWELENARFYTGCELENVHSTGWETGLSTGWELENVRSVGWELENVHFTVRELEKLTILQDGNLRMPILLDLNVRISTLQDTDLRNWPLYGIRLLQDKNLRLFFFELETWNWRHYGIRTWETGRSTG